MLFEKSCGGVVYRKHHGNIEVLLVKHINSGHWSFPKGHVEGEATEEQTARREIKEETGIDVMIDTSFRETVNFSPKKDTQKEVVYYLCKARCFDIVPQIEEVSEARWVDIGYAASVLTYENDRVIIGRVRNVIKDRIC